MTCYAERTEGLTLKAKGWISILGLALAAAGCVQSLTDEQLGSVEQRLGGSAPFGGAPSFCPSVAGAWPITVDAVADTQLEEALPTTSGGGLETCTMKGGSNTRHCLLQFDLTSIPTSTQVVGGCLVVFVTDPSASDYPAARLLRSWSESVATWERAKLAVPWQVPGAWGTLDSGSTTVATIPKNRTEWTSVPVTTSLLQDWVTTPSGNYGMVFGNNSSYDGASIATKEHTSHLTAKLVVWTEP